MLRLYLATGVARSYSDYRGRDVVVIRDHLVLSSNEPRISENPAVYVEEPAFQRYYKSAVPAQLFATQLSR